MENVGENENNNLYSLYMNYNIIRPIRIRPDGSVSALSQQRIRREFNINIRGRLSQQERRRRVMTSARQLRNPEGPRFRNERYAYRFLATLYNESAEINNELARENRRLYEEMVERVRDFTVNNRDESIPITRQMINELGMVVILRAIAQNIGQQRVTLEVSYADAPELFFTFDPAKITQLAFDLEASQVNEESTLVGSDKEWLNELDIIQDITIKRVRDTNANQNANGSFFKWLNKTPFDFRKYGIYDKCENENYIDNCLIHALKQVDGIENKKIDACKGMMFNRAIPICKLNKIADTIGMNIRLMKKDNCKKSNIYGSHKYANEIKLGLVDSHYFIIDKTNFTSYALKNYKELQAKYETIDDYRTIYKMKNKKGKLYPERDEKRCINSYQAINMLYDGRKEYLSPIAYDDEIFGTIYFDKAIDYINENASGLDYDEEYCLKLNDYDEDKEVKKKSKSDKFKNIYFDFETSKVKTKDPYIHEKINNLKAEFHKKKKSKYYIEKLLSLKGRLWRTIHRPYLCCARWYDAKRKQHAKAYAIGDDCGKKILQMVCENGGNDKNKKYRMIAHNCGFDFRFMMNYLFAVEQKTKGNGLMNAKGKFCVWKGDTSTTFDFEFKDSYKLITMPLRKFGSCFKLEQEKEVFPYCLYNNYKNLVEGYVPVEKAKKELGEKYSLFLDNVRRLKMVKHNDAGVEMFHMMDYAKYYCEKDCEVLMNGYNTFRKWCLEDEIIQIDVNCVWTIASLANKVLMKHGCFEDVYQVGGRVRHFLQKCVVGGRCCTRDNKKWKVEDKIADLDAVSLYPSAFYRMKGFLKGKPKVIPDANCNDDFINKQDGYFIKVKITKVGKKYHIPCMSYVDSKTGIRNWTNEMVGKICYIDKTTLEDWKRFQEIEYDILCGYYYNNGRNSTINHVIKELFDIRLKKKKEKNPIQVVYKLIMNSAYGKTILKPIATDEKVIYGESEMKKYLDRHYNSIIEYYRIFDYRTKNNNKIKPKYIFKIQKDIMEHFNNAPVGIECLSMSKRIMFEPMCLAEDMGINIYITDTDSMHIEYDKVPDLVKEFKKKYGRDLEGKKLGQLHIDFDLDGCSGEISSKKSIYLGKKCYIDIIEGENDKGEMVEGHHIRMKGVPNSTLYYTANQYTKNGEDNDKLWNMYERLFNGERIGFDLLEGGNRVNFKFNGDFTIGYMKEFERILSFNAEKGQLIKCVE
tara:strand:+ start:2636 stop:6244 length:3609 start_codon:yes stop_codon:yes gene_type:complete